MKAETYNIGIAKLAKAFMDRKIDGEFMWEYLRDIDCAKFLKAIDKIIMTSDQVNKATNLIALIRRHATDDGYIAEQAWTDVLSEARRVGLQGKPFFKNEATRKAVECITWRTICLSEDLGFDRGVFIRAYNNFVAQEQKNESLLAVEGPVKDMIGNLVKKVGVA